MTLAVSLHTPDDELRDTLVPVNNRWPVAEVLDAARYYADRTGRRVSIEYALIRDVNDQPWRADLLGRLLHRTLGPLVHVNLIPLNPTPGSEWDASPKPVEREFVRRVIAQGVSCTVRDTRGREIAAACGQLAAEGVHSSRRREFRSYATLRTQLAAEGCTELDDPGLRSYATSRTRPQGSTRRYRVSAQRSLRRRTES